MSSILLIYPPAVKPCEAPAGIAKLCGVLQGNGVPCTIVDANIEGLLYLLNNHQSADDTWSKRATKNLSEHLNALRSPEIYKHPARYQRAISDINRVLQISSQPFNTQLSLGNYQDNKLSPLNSNDLLSAAKNPEHNLFYPYFSQRIDQLIAQHNPRHIGLSLNFLSQALTTFAMLGYIKKNFPEIKLLIGGGLVTSWLRSRHWTSFSHQLGPFTHLVDHIFDGPAEGELLHYLNGSTAKTDFPPDYRQLPLADYLSPGMILPYSASNGCYWNRCKFCPEQAEGNHYHSVATHHALEQLHTLVALHTPKLIHFLDNAISPKLLKALSTTPLNTPWYGFTRVTEQLSDLAFCRRLKEAGCSMLKLGIESGNQQVLNAMEKGVTVELNGRVLETLSKAGIATYVYLLFGTPCETEEMAQDTLDFVRKFSGCITFLNVAIFNLPIASALANTLERHSFYTADLSLYTDFNHPENWGRKKIRRFLDRKFKKTPEIAAILQRDPAQFTSNHAPFTLPSAR